MAHPGDGPFRLSGSCSTETDFGSVQAAWVRNSRVSRKSRPMVRAAKRGDVREIEKYFRVSPSPRRLVSGSKTHCGSKTIDEINGCNTSMLF